LVNIYELRHVDQLDRHYGNVPNKLALLMLAQLHDKPYEDMTPVERWAYAFNDENLRSGVKKINELKKIEDPEKLAKGDPALLEFLERIESQNLPTRVVDRFQKFVRDFNLSMADIRQKLMEAGKEEGIQAGIALGKEEGEHKKAFEIARNLLALNLPVDQIAQATGLSISEIESLT
jgi:predicted transposase/invertase (TIGR01784 family)